MKTSAIPFDLTSVGGVTLLLPYRNATRNLRNSDADANRSKALFLTVRILFEWPIYTHFSTGINNDIALRFQSIGEVEARLTDLGNPCEEFQKERFEAEARHQPRLFEVSGPTRREQYRTQLAPLEGALNAALQKIPQGCQGFNSCTSSLQFSAKAQRR